MNTIFDELTNPPSSPEHTEQTPKQTLKNDEELSQQTTQYTPQQIKSTAQELLKCGLLEMDNKPNLYQTAISYQTQINTLLEPFDLQLRIDDIRGLAYVIVAEKAFESIEEEWSHPLVRRQRLTLEQSLVLALLRQSFVNHEMESGAGAAGAVVALDDLLPQVQIYLGDLGSEIAEQKRLRNLLDKLKTHGIVSDIDKHDQITIRPIITHVANPENLKALLSQMQQQTIITPSAE